MRQRKKARARQLTQKRIEYIELIAKGWTNKAIAEHYGITHGGVSTTIQKIFRFANVQSRQELIQWAYDNDINGKANPDE